MSRAACLTMRLRSRCTRTARPFQSLAPCQLSAAVGCPVAAQALCKSLAGTWVYVADCDGTSDRRQWRSCSTHAPTFALHANCYRQRFQPCELSACWPGVPWQPLGLTLPVLAVGAILTDNLMGRRDRPMARYCSTNYVRVARELPANVQTLRPAEASACCRCPIMLNFCRSPAGTWVAG
jgi:hypothetical protein